MKFWFGVFLGLVYLIFSQFWFDCLGFVSSFGVQGWAGFVSLKMEVLVNVYSSSVL